MSSADDACPGRYCSLECQRAARRGHREACKGVKKAAGQEPAWGTVVDGCASVCLCLFMCCSHFVLLLKVQALAYLL